MRIILSLILAVTLSACATSSKIGLSVLEINSLHTDQKNTGSFQGLEYLADPIPGGIKNRVNIMYLHGIGFTEDRTKAQLAGDFLGGIAKAYDLDASDGVTTTLCGEAPITEADKAKTHIYIKADRPQLFDTAIPGSQLALNDLVCMDKQVLSIDENLEFVLYRVFWDNIFWDGLQFAHVGQDDNRGSSEAIALQRKKYNRRLKDELVNYGFSDAVMYLGPAGDLIQNAVKGAMCSAALDAAGFEFAKQSQGEDERIQFSQACETANNTRTQFNQFAFVTESLGSKIMYDVMRKSMTDEQDTIHDRMISGSEVYMLANQVALLSLSDVGTDIGQSAELYSMGPRPKIVAMSELNDFLTYELVPFYEQLYKRSLRGGRASSPISLRGRQDLINSIGFDVIDMRLEFADRIIPPLGSFVDPLDAHSGHASEPELMVYVLCGAVDGQKRDEQCLATAELE
jgi:hypothetical protein